MPRGLKEGEGWTEAKTIKFLMLVACSFGTSPVANFAAVAEKMGPEVTVGSLKNKWQRIKAEVDKDGGIPTTPAKNGAGGKKAGTPKKTAGGGSEDDEETATPKPGSKRKANGATPKSKKPKVTSEAESEEGEIKEPAEEVKEEIWAEV